jgi:hypothetical protein
VDEASLDNRVPEPVRGRDHPRVVLGVGGDADANMIADVEDAPIAGRDLAADVKTLVEPDHRRVGPTAARNAMPPACSSAYATGWSPARRSASKPLLLGVSEVDRLSTSSGIAEQPGFPSRAAGLGV